MNKIIAILERTIDKKLHLQQNQQGWLIPDENTNIQVRALHEHSMSTAWTFLWMFLIRSRSRTVLPFRC